MSSENKYFYLNNKKYSIEQFQIKIGKQDFADNKNIDKLISFFDKDNNGILDKTKLETLFKRVKSASRIEDTDPNLNENEAKALLASFKSDDNISLKELGITTNELFGFIKTIADKHNQIQILQYLPTEIPELTSDEIKTISINTLNNDLDNAKKIFNTKKGTQGDISKLVSDTNEILDGDYAMSRVSRYLKQENSSLELLNTSKENNLTIKEYYQAKIDLIKNLLPELANAETKNTIYKTVMTLGLYEKFGGKTQAGIERAEKELELELLQKQLARLTPKELFVLTRRLINMSEEEFAQTAPKLVDNIIQKSLSEIQQDLKPEITDGQELNIKKEVKPDSIEELMTKVESSRKMTFDEVFLNERGVVYDQDAMLAYTKKETHLNFLVGLHNRNEEIKNLLASNTALVDGNDKFGADENIRQTSIKNLEISLNTAFKQLFGNDTKKMQKMITQILGVNSGISINKDENGNFKNLEFGNNSVSSYLMVKLSKGLQYKVEQNYQKALDGKSLDEYSAETKSAYEVAFGARNAKDIANNFIQTQEEGVQYTKVAVQSVGMLVMVAGQLIPVGGQMATASVAANLAKTAITTTGLVTSSLGSVGISAIENFTKPGGATDEDKQAILKELATSLVLVKSGMEIGKASEAVFKTLVAKNCPKLLAYAAEVGTDAISSLFVDYAVTGEIDLSAEGIAQLQNILVGLVLAKGNLKNYIDNHAGDVNTTTKINTSTSKSSTPLQTETKLTTLTNGDVLKTDVITYADGSKVVELRINGKLIENNITPVTDPSKPKTLISGDSSLMQLSSGEEVLVRIDKYIDGSQEIVIACEDQFVEVNNRFKTSETLNNEIQSGEIRTKKEIDDNLNILFNRLEKASSIYAINNKINFEEFKNAFDYENANIHLEHFNDIVSKNMFHLGDITKNGYFSSKEGAEAFEYIIKRFNSNASFNTVSPAETILSSYTTKEALQIKSRNLNDKNIELAKLTDEEWNRRELHPNKDNLNYVSESDDINNLLATLKHNQANHQKFSCTNIERERKIENIVSQMVEKSANKEKTLAMLHNLLLDKKLSTYDFLSKISDSNFMAKYEKAYDYLIENEIPNTQIVFINPDKRNIYRAGNIRDLFGEKQTDNWDLMVFDNEGNFIRRNQGNTSNTSVSEIIETESSKQKYRASINTQGEHELLITSKKEVFGNNDEPLYTEFYVKSNAVENKYDIYREFPDGKRYKIGIAEHSNNGDVIIEKTFEHKNGVKTDYNYFETPQGSKLAYSKITNKNGSTIFENKFNYKVIDENHFKTNENGVEYDIKYSSSSVTVTRQDGEKVSIKIGSSTSRFGVLGKELLPILKKMPGSFYFKIKEYGLNKIGKEINNVSENNAHYSSEKNLIAISKEWGDGVFTLCHEFGHYIDQFTGISKESDIIDTFKRERDAFTKQESVFEANSMHYLIDAYCRRTEDMQGSISEMVAEVNGFLYASNTDPNIELRGQMLQQYFPETFAKIAAKLRQ